MKPSERHTPKLKLRKRLLFSSIALLIFLFAMFLITEITIRIFFPQTMNVYSYDSDYVFKFRPYATINYTSHEFSQVTTFSSQGFKDNEYAYENKPAGTYRVLVLGDSFSVGLEVGLNETFVKLLEKDLRRWHPERKIEVLSVATNGWSTEQELLFLQKEGLSYKPDMVVLAFYVGNDPIDNMERNLFMYDGHSLTRNTDRPLAQSRLRAAYYFLSSNFHTFNLAMYTWWKIQDSFGTQGGIDYDNAFLPYIQHDESLAVAASWQKTFALLDQMQSTLNGIPLMLLIIPDRIQESPDFRKKHEVPGTGIVLNKPQTKLSTFANARSITVIDLLPAFQEEAVVKQLRFEKDFHWNPVGHVLAATTTAPIINTFINQQSVAQNNVK